MNRKEASSFIANRYGTKSKYQLIRVVFSTYINVYDSATILRSMVFRQNNFFGKFFVNTKLSKERKRGKECNAEKERMGGGRRGLTVSAYRSLWEKAELKNRKRESANGEDVKHCERLSIKKCNEIFEHTTKCQGKFLQQYNDFCLPRGKKQILC